MIAIIFEVTYFEDNGCKYAGHLPRTQICQEGIRFMSVVNRKVMTWSSGEEI